MRWRNVVLAVWLAAGAALPAAAQTADVKLKGKLEELWRSKAYTMNPGGSFTVYEVPADRRLVLTDVVLPNPHASAITVRVDSGEATTIELALQVAAAATFSHAFTTGIPFEPGSEVRVRYVAGPAPIEIHLTGLLLKAK
jgi:hypothetical protein